MTCSNKRACVVYEVNQFEEVIYFGDGSWDAVASKSLGYRFVGVAVGEQVVLLTELGAIDVIVDYADVGQVIAALTCRNGSRQRAVLEARPPGTLSASTRSVATVVVRGQFWRSSTHDHCFADA